MKMTGENIPLLVGAGVGVGVLAGVVSGVCFILANGLGWSRRVHRSLALKDESYSDENKGCATCGGNKGASNAECSSCTLPVCDSCIDQRQNRLTCKPCSKDRLVFTSTLTKDNSLLQLLKDTFTFRPPTGENLNQLKVARSPGALEVSTGAAAAVTNGGQDEGRQIREFLQHLAEKLTGGSLDDVSVSRMYQNSEYDRMFKMYHGPVCSAISSLSIALRSSSRNLPVTNMESASSAHSRLQRLIQRIIEEALHLPAFLDFSGSLRDANGKLPEFNPKTYEDLLATAILNKVINRYQQEPKQSAGASSSGVHSGSSSPGCENAPLSGRPAARRRGRPRTVSKDILQLDRSSPEPLSHDDYANSDSSGRKETNRKSEYSSDEDEPSDPRYSDPVETALSTIDFKNRNRVAFPEFGGHVIELEGNQYMNPFLSEDLLETNGAINNNTDIYTNNNSWEENWLFQKKKVKSTQSVSVPMLVPNPNMEYRARIGDRDAEDTTDLSEADGSESDEKSDDSNDIKKVLISSKTIIGGKNPVLALIDTNQNDDNTSSGNNVHSKQTLDQNDSATNIIETNDYGTVNPSNVDKLNVAKDIQNSQVINYELIDVDSTISDKQDLVDHSSDEIGYGLPLKQSETNDTANNENSKLYTCDFKRHDNIMNSEFREEQVNLDEAGDSNNECSGGNISNNEILNSKTEENAPWYTRNLSDITEDSETSPLTTSPKEFANKILNSIDSKDIDFENMDTSDRAHESGETNNGTLLDVNGDNDSSITEANKLINGENTGVTVKVNDEEKSLESQIAPQIIKDIENNGISLPQTQNHEIKEEKVDLDKDSNDLDKNTLDDNEISKQVELTPRDEFVDKIYNDIVNITIQAHKDNFTMMASQTETPEVSLIEISNDDKECQASVGCVYENKENIVEHVVLQNDSEIKTKDNSVTSVDPNESFNEDKSLEDGGIKYIPKCPTVTLEDFTGIEYQHATLADEKCERGVIESTLSQMETLDDCINFQIMERELSVQTSSVEINHNTLESLSIAYVPEIVEEHCLNEADILESTQLSSLETKGVDLVTNEIMIKENLRIDTIEDLVTSLHQDEVDTSLPSIEVDLNTFITRDINEATNLDVDDKQDADGHQQESEYLETISVPVQRHMDSLKRQHNITVRHVQDDISPPPLPTSRLPDKKEGLGNELFIPGSIAEREHMKWQNAVPMENNPYSPEAIERRLKKFNKPALLDMVPKTPNHSLDEEQDTKPKTKPLQEVFREDVTEFKRYGRDYYINESKKGTGTRKHLLESRAMYLSVEEETADRERPTFIRSASETRSTAWEERLTGDNGHVLERPKSEAKLCSMNPPNSQEGIFSAKPAKSEPDLYSATPILVDNVDEQFNVVFKTTFNSETHEENCSENSTFDDSATHSDILDISTNISSPDDSMLVYNIQTGKVLSDVGKGREIQDNGAEDEMDAERITSQMINNMNKSWKSTGDVYLAAIEHKDRNEEKVNVIEEDIDLPSVKNLRKMFTSAVKDENEETKIQEKPKRKLSKDFPSDTITKTYSSSQHNLRQPLHMHSLTARSIPKEFRDELKQSMPVPTNITHPGGSKEIPQGIGEPIREGKNMDRPDSPLPEPGSLRNKLAFFEKLTQK